MKKAFVLLGAFVFCMTFGVKGAWAIPPATDVDCTAPCISSFEIEDGAVTSADIADGTVDTVDIAPGAVTDAKITGPISRGNLETPSNRVVVAVGGGGDFTTITAALAAITPSAANPYVIDVMPGTYTESNIETKSYVHLRGAGREVTTIDGSASGTTIYILEVNNVAISGFTVIGSNYVVYGDTFSNVTLSDNTFTGASFGIYPYDGSNLTIKDNIITGNGYGFLLYWITGFTLKGNTITGNGNGDREDDAVHINQSSGTVVGNVITNNGNGINADRNAVVTIIGNTITGHVGTGLDVYRPTSAIIINNNISGNGTGGGPYDKDIFISSGTANISHNIFDTVDGTITGAYNVKSDGTPWP